jgi:malonate transporter MadL subunit
MTIFGVALLAICTLIGVFLGDVLGVLLHVKSNVGGVGLAMVLLIAARLWLEKRDKLTHGVKLGVEFWGSIYIPIVVAMAAQQNVVAAVSNGPMVVIAAVSTVILCFCTVALLGRKRPSDTPPSAEIATQEAHAELVISGDPT